MEASSSLYNHFLTLNNKLNEQYTSTTGYAYRYEITYPNLRAKHKGKDATVSIDEHAHIQINDSNHLLLTSSSEGTTNISYFPNTVYSTDKNRLIVQPVTDVTLYPGDFIEFYPITKSPCFLYSSTLMGGPSSAVSSNRKPRYIYFNENGNVFIQDNDKGYSTTTSSSSIQITFLVSNGLGAYSPVIIKK